jgi:zinc protease
MRTSKTRLVPLLLALLPALTAAPAALAAPGLPDVRILDNGLRVVVLEDHALPLVVASLWVHVGSKDEIETSAGYAHFLEHLLPRTGNPKAAFEYQRLAHRWGGDLVVRANYDRTYLTISGVPSALPDIVGALADMALRASLEDKEIDLELGSLHQEIKSYYDEPESVAFLETMRQTFPGHMYRFPPLGNFRTLGTLKHDPLAAFYRNLYVPNNMALVLAGDLDPVRAAALIDAAFGRAPKSVTLAPKPAPPAGFAGHIDPIEKRLAVAQTWVTLSFAAPGYRHPDRPAFEALARALGDAGGGPIATALQRNRLASATRVSFYRLEDAGMLYVGIQPATTELSYDAARAALAEIIAVKKRAWKPEELQPVIDRLVHEARLRHEQLTDLSETLGEAALLGGLRYAWNLPEAYGALTAEDLRRVASRYLVIENLRAVLILPTAAAPFPQEKKDAFHDLLDTLGGATSASVHQAAAAAAPGATAPASTAPGGPAVTGTTAPDAPPTGPGFDRVLYAGNDAWRVSPEIWGNPRDARGLKAAERTVLDNGFTLLVQEDHRSRLAAVALFLRAGSADDPPGKGGLATVAGHLMTPLSAPPGWGEFRRTPTRALLAPEVQVTRDLVESRFVVAPEDVGLALPLLASALKEPQFNQAAFDQFRRGAAEALQQSANDPAYVALDLFREKVYAGHPYGRPGDGTPAGLLALRRDDVTAFQSASFRPDRAVLSVAGDVSAPELARQVKSLFGSWKPGKSTAGASGAKTGAGAGADGAATATAQAEAGRFSRVLASRRCDVLVGVPGTPVGHADFNDLRALGTAVALQAFEDMVFGRRAAFSAVALPEGWRDGGSLAFEVAASPNRCDEALFDLQKLLRALALEGLAADEARDVARVQQGKDAAGLMGVAATASALGYREASGLDAVGYRRALAQPAEPPLDRLKDVAGRYLKPDAWIIVRVGPSSP